MKKRIVLLALLGAAWLPLNAVAQEDETETYIYATYMICDTTRQDEADAILQQLIDGVEGDSAYFQVAESMAFRDRLDEAFEWLELAYEHRDNGIVEMMTSPFLKPLHADDRWPALLEKLGLRQSAG